MHELLLHAHVSADRHDQILNILAGIAAMQPQPLLEANHIFVPNRSPASVAAVHVGGTQDVDTGKNQAGSMTASRDLFVLQLNSNLLASALSEEKTKGQGLKEEAMTSTGGAMEVGYSTAVCPRVLSLLRTSCL